MNRVGGRNVILVLGLSVAAAEHEGPDQPATPAEQYKAILKEYQVASSGGVLSDEERMKFVGRVFKLRDKLALTFVGNGHRRGPGETDQGGRTERLQSFVVEVTRKLTELSRDEGGVLC